MYLKTMEQLGSAWEYKETKAKNNLVGFAIP